MPPEASHTPLPRFGVVAVTPRRDAEIWDAQRAKKGLEHSPGGELSGYGGPRKPAPEGLDLGLLPIGTATEHALFSGSC